MIVQRSGQTPGIFVLNCGPIQIVLGVVRTFGEEALISAYRVKYPNGVVAIG
jgi:hypothetical protein